MIPIRMRMSSSESVVPSTSSIMSTSSVVMEMSDIYKLYILFNHSDYKPDYLWSFRSLITNNTLDTFLQITSTFKYNEQKQTGNIVNLSFCLQYNILYNDRYCSLQDMTKYVRYCPPIRIYVYFLYIVNSKLKTINY